MQLPVVGVVNKGVTGQGGVAHGVGEVLLDGFAAGALGAAADVLRGAVLAGKYSEPVWPQAATVSTLRARARCLTRIRAAFNMLKL